MQILCQFEEIDKIIKKSLMAEIVIEQKVQRKRRKEKTLKYNQNKAKYLFLSEKKTTTTQQILFFCYFQCFFHF